MEKRIVVIKLPDKAFRVSGELAVHTLAIAVADSVYHKTYIPATMGGIIGKAQPSSKEWKSIRFVVYVPPKAFFVKGEDRDAFGMRKRWVVAWGDVSSMLHHATTTGGEVEYVEDERFLGTK